MDPQSQYQYSIFKTRWGWFGLLGNESGLVRTCLPVAFREAVERRLLSGLCQAEPAKKAFRPLENDILSYYKSRRVEFADVPVCLEGLTDFQKEVLTALRTVTYGQTVSYGEMARLVNNPKASRAIGAVMAINPLPLIIPCHRVIKTDGSLGYFSAAGGVHTKQRMLDLEKY
ncbi:MAG: methylated-DNA--[protein]-cysteine S-methyltransferase [Chitinivibrionales bacterium]|nr:methylated-DNA--[protein]-cysteine S-methyltransferase [Chitinivibrionales bacterium]